MLRCVRDGILNVIEIFPSLLLRFRFVLSLLSWVCNETHENAANVTQIFVLDLRSTIAHLISRFVYLIADDVHGVAGAQARQADSRSNRAP